MRFSALASWLSLFRLSGFFFSTRLIVSALYIRKRVHQKRGCDGYKEEELRTFSSSSFFSERCFRIRAVSSRLSASFRCLSCVIFHLYICAPNS